ncbi:MAG: ribonuclease R [Bacilli bacterium]|nr:ribonuclease R [Bacilli bacterium]
MQDKILELLNKDNRPFSVYDINDALGLKTVDELKELLKNLNELEDNLKIYRTKKDTYLLFNNSNLRVGTLIANKKGFGFVDIEGDEDIFIAPPNMNNAIHNDKVIVEITSKKGMSLEGRILRIMARELKPMVGLLAKNKMGYYIKLDDDKVKINILIDNKDRKGALEGHKVLVKVCNKLKGNDYRGEILKILGHVNDPGVDILSVVYKYQIEDKFSDEAIKELDYIKEEVDLEDLKNRIDLRDKLIFTIDGDDTKDIDDAISLEKLDNGNYKLGVHIADVSYYVKVGTKLNEEAMDRGTSVYLADRVIPMLPHKLSNGICSLNPNVDRLTITCEMEINPKGKIISYDIFESVINSKIQMTYKNVNSILEDNIVPIGYEPYKDTLILMSELAKALRKYKVSRGYIDFGIDESKIIVDENGKAIDVKLRYRGIGENMIEDFMIAANESVAEYMTNMELPFIYRVHGVPSSEKIDNFIKFIHVLGYNIESKIKNVTPISMQKLLDSLKDKEEHGILANLLLRSMQKAVYSKENIGHFGLASTCYTHFTSPIRRYPDQMVHRLLRTFIFNKGINKDNIKYYEQVLPMIAEHSSYKERCSIDCEREVDDMKKAEYMEDHVGEEFIGMISTVTSFGMFIELSNLIEGLVKLDSLKGEFYFDEELFQIRNKENTIHYRLGDKVKVKLINANKETRNIDFEVV